MSPSPSVRFARTAQVLAAAARRLGLAAPAFRSPPRLVGVHRSIKRWEGGAAVAVAVRDRPWPAVQADLVEGVIAANDLDATAADRARAQLWEALDAASSSPAPSRENSASVEGSAPASSPGTGPAPDRAVPATSPATAPGSSSGERRQGAAPAPGPGESRQGAGSAPGPGERRQAA